MSYPSIDTLQKILSERIFSHTQDAKKAAGRALGTIIEIISFYLLREWGFNKYISIERGLAEYGNPEIKHNVEFTLHPLISEQQITFQGIKPITSRKLLKSLNYNDIVSKNNTLIDKNERLKNACIIAETNKYIVLASLLKMEEKNIVIDIYQQHKKPYAMFECKRVGIEDGTKKGPQTIEKAKQGAYVAKMTSSLQKIRTDKGKLYGIIYEKGQPIIKPYTKLLYDIIYGHNSHLLTDFTLSIGIVSNHGNWFTSDDMNKELKVLAQSYDWLLFLTDLGLAQFISELLLNPKPEYQAIQNAFFESYKEGKKSNIFTKTKIDYKAHIALQSYFHKNISTIETWFNIITPKQKDMQILKNELELLSQKNWREIL